MKNVLSYKLELSFFCLYDKSEEISISHITSSFFKMICFLSLYSLNLFPRVISYIFFVCFFLFFLFHESLLLIHGTLYSFLSSLFLPSHPFFFFFLPLFTLLFSSFFFHFFLIFLSLISPLLSLFSTFSSLSCSVFFFLNFC